MQETCQASTSYEIPKGIPSANVRRIREKVTLKTGKNNKVSVEGRQRAPT